MEVLLVIWLLCACLAAVIMNSKTDSQAKIALYFVIGLVLGIFGILLAIAAPNEKSASAASGQVVSQAQKACHYCKELILADAIKCRHCGERLEPERLRT